jgi:hypothetical protein
MLEIVACCLLFDCQVQFVISDFYNWFKFKTIAMCHCDTSKVKGQLQLPFKLYTICLKAESSSQKPYFSLPDADGSLQRMG